jgi:thiamine biosynthesis lipoprotein
MQPGGVTLDFSAIAKGFAVDRVAQLLDRPEVSTSLVEIGGELKARGIKPDAQPWWVEIEHPPDDAADSGFPEIRIALCGLAIASSGDYRRYFEHDGSRYSHTLDPLSGAPITHPIASVTVLHEECMLADAYSTALAVMGPVEGLAFADKNRLAAVFILRNKQTYRPFYSRIFREMLENS